MVAAFSPELEQGRKVHQFLKENVTCPIYYQQGLDARESAFLRNTDGTPKYMILPYPFSYDRQVACLHEYGHYYDQRPVTDVNHRSNLTKRKAARHHAGIRRHFTQAEVAAWMNAIGFIRLNHWGFPQQVYLDMIANYGLRTYYDLWKKDGGLPYDLLLDFNYLFWQIEDVSPGFRGTHAITNYYVAE